MPRSYEEFIKTFGYGKVLSLIIIFPAYVEFYGSLEREAARIKGFIREAVDGGWMEFEPDGTLELAQRLFPFAASENGEYFAWDIDCAGEKRGKAESWDVSVGIIEYWKERNITEHEH